MDLIQTYPQMAHGSKAKDRQEARGAMKLLGAEPLGSNSDWTDLVI